MEDCVCTFSAGAGSDHAPLCPAKTWTTEQLRESFEVLGFGGGLCVVRRRSDGVRGSLQFDHSPRLYYSFEEG